VTSVAKGAEAFWKAQDKIYRVLEEQCYPSFLLSDLFHSYTKKKKSSGEISTYFFFYDSKYIKIYAVLCCCCCVFFAIFDSINVLLNVMDLVSILLTFILS